MPLPVDDLSEFLHPFNRGLAGEELTETATYFKNKLTEWGWSLNAICACLGNWQSECALCTNNPQFGSYFPDPMPDNGYGGFGLPQWTSWYKKIGRWARETYGLYPDRTDNNPLCSFNLQIEYHNYECIYGTPEGKTWYSNHGWDYGWEEFKISTDDVSDMAIAYYWQYERSGAMDPGSRPAQAAQWFSYFGGGPGPGPGPGPSGDKIPKWMLFKFKDIGGFKL